MSPVKVSRHQDAWLSDVTSEGRPPPGRLAICLTAAVTSEGLPPPGRLAICLMSPVKVSRHQDAWLSV